MKPRQRQRLASRILRTVIVMRMDMFMRVFVHMSMPMLMIVRAAIVIVAVAIAMTMCVLKIMRMPMSTHVSALMLMHLLMPTFMLMFVLVPMLMFMFMPVVVSASTRCVDFALRFCHPDRLSNKQMSNCSYIITHIVCCRPTDVNLRMPHVLQRLGENLLDMAVVKRVIHRLSFLAPPDDT